MSAPVGCWRDWLPSALVLFGLLALAAPATGQDKGADTGTNAGAVQPFPAAAKFEGGPRERGAAYGKLYQREIREFFEREILQAFVGRPSSKEALLAYAQACGRVVRDECPLVADEFQGIAEGAGLSFDEIVLINLHEELYHRVELPTAKHGHCTAVAVGPQETGEQRTYVGQTWDWMQSVAGKSRVVEWRRPGGSSVLAYGFPGMPMGAGMNSQGVALCWTSAALGEKGQAPRVGIPSYMLIAHLLAHPDRASVIREAKKNKHAGWFTFVMGFQDGALLNIEGSPERVVIEEPADRLARVLYGSREMTGAKGPPPLHARCQKMYDLLQATRGKNNLQQLQQYFGEPEFKINVGKDTIDMMVFDVTQRRAYLSRGASYGAAWREYRFAEP